MRVLPISSSTWLQAASLSPAVHNTDRFCGSIGPALGAGFGQGKGLAVEPIACRRSARSEISGSRAGGGAGRPRSTAAATADRAGRFRNRRREFGISVEKRAAIPARDWRQGHDAPRPGRPMAPFWLRSNRPPTARRQGRQGRKRRQRRQRHCRPAGRQLAARRWPAVARRSAATASR